MDLSRASKKIDSGSMLVILGVDLSDSQHETQTSKVPRRLNRGNEFLADKAFMITL